MTLHNPFLTEILEQPAALRQCLADRAAVLKAVDRIGPAPRRVLLTGMGASYHAAICGRHLLQGRGVLASARESAELLNYGHAQIGDADVLIVISQSGASAEIEPLLRELPAGLAVIGLTNAADSVLGRYATAPVPLQAGVEQTVASKTWMNTLVRLYQLADAWHPVASDALSALPEAVAELVDDRDRLSAQWADALSGSGGLYCVGHGPHVASARQTAMMVGEWMKEMAIGTSIGAFRHGLIEAAGPGDGVVLFGAGGDNVEAALSVTSLARELEGYGVGVLEISEGRPAGAAARRFDEWLGVLLDVVAAQIFVEAEARRRAIPPAFRNISKVVRQL